MRGRSAVALALVVSLGSAVLWVRLGAQEATRSETSEVIRSQTNQQSRPIQPVAAPEPAQAQRLETQEVTQMRIDETVRSICMPCRDEDQPTVKGSTSAQGEEGITTTSTLCSVGGSVTINTPPDGSPPIGCTPNAAGECNINFDIDYDVSCSTTDPPPVNCTFCLYWKIEVKLGLYWGFVADSNTAKSRNCNTNNHFDVSFNRYLAPGTSEQPRTYRIIAGVKEKCDDTSFIFSAMSVFHLYEE